jgi:hypothetical protein
MNVGLDEQWKLTAFLRLGSNMWPLYDFRGCGGNILGWHCKFEFKGPDEGKQQGLHSGWVVCTTYPIRPVYE